jgi:hypothetical protein
MMLRAELPVHRNKTLYGGMAYGTSTCATTSTGAADFTPVGESDGHNHRTSQTLAIAPAPWATTNPGTSAGRMPAKVSVRARASVTAGLAKDVDAVNQYAAAI